MKKIVLILLFPLYTFAQTDIEVPVAEKPKDENRLVRKHRLTPNWRSFSGDTISPTEVKADFNGDGKLDLCAMHIGFSGGLYLMNNIDGELSIDYDEPYDSTWYNESGFIATLSKGNKNDTIKTISGSEVFAAKNDYIKIHFSNGEVDALLYLNGEVKKIRLSTTELH